jgi:CubicO group peptidase (beta-lactamase class C family)
MAAFKLRHLLRGLRTLLVAAAAHGLTAGAAAQTPRPAPTPRPHVTVEGITFGPEATLLAMPPGQQRVAYRNLRLLAPHNLVARGREVSPLPQASIDLGGFTYDFQNRTRSLDDFMAETRVAGLLIIKDGRVAAERYAHGHGHASVWVSFSVAKSVLSLLYGAALKDGSIRSLDDTVTRYLPQLRGSAYDEVTLRHLLQMSSGVAWVEDGSDPTFDLAKFARAGRAGGLEAQLAYMKQLQRQAPPGTVFNYNTGETNVAGAVLRAATGKTLAEYLSEKIWRPAGMESDAYWLLLREGDSEHGGCCISATLRDYGRLGLLALRGGTAVEGASVLPDGWMKEATTPAPTAPNYGYLWWLDGGGGFAASGLFGQYIYVDRGRRLVVAIHALWPAPVSRELTAHRRAFLQALTRAVSDGPRGTR